MIDTVIIKASYDLMALDTALDSVVLKYADDVAKGKQLQTLKIPRFASQESSSAQTDFLKFNFPVCGNLSAADLMTIYAVMEGFNVVVVSNEERQKRTEVIRHVVGADQQQLRFVPELDVPLTSRNSESEFIDAQQKLSFTNTQARGYSQLSHQQQQKLTLELAGDLPLLFNIPYHATVLDRNGCDLVINLNDVTTMQSIMPSFKRNGYTHLINSRGEAVWIKENNVFAQSMASVKKNRRLFDSLYRNRNGGGYEMAVLATAFHKVGRLLSNKESYALVRDVRNYLRDKENNPVPYDSVMFGAHVVFSPKNFPRTAFGDATNIDIFSCMDLDGLNNDFRDYKIFFDRNMGALSQVVPFAEEIYKVDEAMGKTEGVFTQDNFRDTFNWFVGEVESRLRNPDYLASLKTRRSPFNLFRAKRRISDDVIDQLRETDIGVSIGEDGKLKYDKPDYSQVSAFVDDLKHHLETRYLPQFYKIQEHSMPVHMVV